MAVSRMRNVRMDDQLWEAVGQKAELEGRSRSDVVRELLVAWVAQPPRPPAKLVTWQG